MRRRRMRVRMSTDLKSRGGQEGKGRKIEEGM